MVDSCPAPELDVTFTLVGRRDLQGDIPLALEPADAGVPDAGGPDGGASGDAGSGAPDAG